MIGDIRWDPDQYDRFAAERARPFDDLLARAEHPDPRSVVDLGCGTGALTRRLSERWPGATVLGIDRSATMLERARPHAIVGRLEFRQGDLAAFSPRSPVDVVVSNAALHWVPDHPGLLAGLTAVLAPGGVLAVQVPDNGHAPSHRAVADLLAEPRWEAFRASAPGVLLLADYVRHLSALGLRVDAWQTTYAQVLRGEDPVLEWLAGTTLRPVLSALDPEGREALRAALAPRLREAYPATDGVTVFPFCRTFFVARR